MKKHEIGQMVKFKHLSVLAAKEFELMGIIKGFGDDVRKKWPIEMAEAPDDMLLIWRKDNFGNEQHYAVMPYDVLDVATVIET